MSAKVSLIPFDRPSLFTRSMRNGHAVAKQNDLASQPQGNDLIQSNLTLATMVTTAPGAELSGVAATTALSLAHGALLLEQIVLTNEALTDGPTQVVLHGFARKSVAVTITVRVVSTDMRPDGQQQVELAAHVVVITDSLEAAETLTTALLSSVPHHVEKPLVVMRAPRRSAEAITPALHLDWRARWSRWLLRP